MQAPTSTSRKSFREPSSRKVGDFDTTVCGIPCQVLIIHASPGRPAKLWGPPEQCYPEEYPEFEFNILDTRGYRARWLESKLTQGITSRIEGEIEDHFKSMLDGG